MSASLRTSMLGTADVSRCLDRTSEEDRALALWMLYELHYRGFEDARPDLEWDPALLGLRRDLEVVLEADLRSLTASLVQDATRHSDDVVEQLELVVSHDGPSLSRFLHRDANAAQYQEFLVQRSIYHLKESDPHVWTLPRLRGLPKAALAEILYDEFGGGVAARVHHQLFADALGEAGLDPTYGAYLDQVPAHILTFNNAMTLFGLHGRLRGASMGHLAALEMTSSLPCRRYAQGADRLGLGAAVVHYFAEHVEADAVHEQLAARSICGSLVRDEPDLQADVLLGAAACILLDEASAAATSAAWADGLSALRTVGDPAAA